MSKQELQDQIDVLASRLANLEAALAYTQQTASLAALAATKAEQNKQVKKAAAAAAKKAGDANA